ncbi:MAG: hypothetical protein CMK59_09055 [Proteobacteria bacterium]|nr:hypothetical protein [Pseudomonadota bacterium]
MTEELSNTTWKFPITISGQTIGESWLKYLSEVLKNGHLYFDEDVQIIERENITLQIQQHQENDQILEKFADQHLMKLYMQKMKETYIIPELNASYGQRIYAQLGVNQFDWLVNRLSKKQETKAATISLLLPNDPGPRIPCLTVMDFKVRYNHLYTKALFRSQNALRAYGNFRAMFWFAKTLGDVLNVSTGELTIFISNAHILRSDEKKSNDIIQAWKNTRKNSI